MNQVHANEHPIPKTMKAWVLGNPEELALVEKPMPEPGPAEVLVRIDAIAVCATDIEILKHGVPAMSDGELPFIAAASSPHYDFAVVFTRVEKDGPATGPSPSLLGVYGGMIENFVLVSGRIRWQADVV